MSQTEELQTADESELIVKTQTEACAKGLIVSGGGKEGIFVKDVLHESPASTIPCMREGDQILSATVFFDDIRYEDALQILEHAKPYKVQFCLKRKSPATSAIEVSAAEPLNITPGETGTTVERGRTKTPRRQEARISWPKFPSFTRERKMYFKRSHSTSEAEEQKTLDMSPTTSDTESPNKSQEPLKTKTKRSKIKLPSLGMRSLKGKSMDQHDNDTVAETSEHLEVTEKYLTEKEIPEICALDANGIKDTSKVNDKSSFPNVTGPEVEISQYKAELIALDKTLKTADISICGPKSGDILVEPGEEQIKNKRTPEGKRRKKKLRSELKVNISGKEKGDISPEPQAMAPQTLILKASPHGLGPEFQFELHTSEAGVRTPEDLELRDAPVSPNVISHAELKGRQLSIDISTQKIDSNRSSVKVEVKKPKERITDKAQQLKSEDDQKAGPEGTSENVQPTASLHMQAPTLEMETESREKSLLSPTIKSVLKPYEAKMEPPAVLAHAEKSKIKMSKKGDPELGMAPVDVPARKEAVGEQKASKIEAEKIIKGKSKHVPEQETHSIITRRQQVEMSKKGIQPRSSETEMQTPKFDSGDVYASDKDSPFLKGDVHMSKPQTETKDTELEQPTQGKKTELYKPKIPKSVISLPNVKTTEREDDLNKSDKTTTEAEASILQPVTGIKITETKSELDLSQSIRKTDTPQMEIKATRIHPELDVDNVIGAMSKSKLHEFKLPKINLSDLDVHEKITMTDVKESKGKSITTAEISHSKGEMHKEETPLHIQLREDTEIQPIRGTAPKGKFKIPCIEKGTEATPVQVDVHFTEEHLSLPGEIGNEIKRIKLHPSNTHVEGEDIQTRSNLNITKFKLPKMEISGFDTHHQITKTELFFDDVPQKTIKSAKTEIKEPMLRDKEKYRDTEIRRAADTFQIPSIEKPKTIFSTTTDITKAEAPKIEGDITLPTMEISLPKADLDVKSPEISTTANIKMPKPQLEAEGQDKDVDIEGSHGKFKMPSFKMPKFGFSTTKVQAEAPEISTDIAIPDIDAPSGKEGVDIDAPIDDIKAPNADIEKPDSQSQLSKMPDLDISLPKVKGTEIGIQLPKAHAGVSVSKPDLEVKGPEVEFKAPALEGKVDVPEIEAKGGRGKFQLPHMKLPSFGISTPDIKVPKIKGDTTLPTVDIPLPKADLDVKSPEIRTTADVKIPKPQLTVSGEKPAVDLMGPSMDIEGKGTETEESKAQR
nr:PREDICTED: neuroblast differentiation-associated protein AHNAK-like [Lepisosteus oculatus]